MTMPVIENGQVRIRYAVSGREDGEWLVLSNSLGSSLAMWDKVVALLESQYRVLRYDTRGHGGSSVPTGPYTIDQLGADVLRLLDEVGAERVSFCGLSLGGLTGMWLGLHASHRLNRLILANTAARIASPQLWNERIDFVVQSGMEQLSAATLARWFTPQYREAHAGEMEQIRQMIAGISPDGYAACCAVLRDTDLRAHISSISVPTLVITGTHDPATPPGDGRAVADAVQGAQYIELDASHMSAWERGDKFADAVLHFLAQGVIRHG
jgi:3-oxoadipate enol-lactonase